MAMDSCEVVSVVSGAWTNTARRGHVWFARLSSLCGPLRRAQAFPLGRLSSLAVWPPMLARDTARPLSLSLSRVVSSVTGGQRLKCPGGGRREGLSLLPNPPWLPFLSRSVAQLCLQFWERLCSFRQ